MRCGNVICQECATAWEGIHYCVGCLANRRVEEKHPSSIGSWLALLIAVAGLGFLLTMTRVLVGAFLVSPIP